jgi:uncharacterized membrane protein
MNRGLWVLILVFILIGSVSAQEYYADINIIVDNSGLTTIYGETNHPMLNIVDSPDLTSKEGKTWLLNISTQDEFSNFIYVLNLPKNAVINYMKLPAFARIEDSPTGLSIIGTGENQEFSIILQYQIKNYKSSNYLGLYLILFILVIITGLYFLLVKKLIKNKKVKLKLPTMSLRQKQIYLVLSKNKKPMTQKQIQDILKLPKSSISRNIETMVKKGILIKEQLGMSNLVSVNED